MKNAMQTFNWAFLEKKAIEGQNRHNLGEAMFCYQNQSPNTYCYFYSVCFLPFNVDAY